MSAEDEVSSHNSPGPLSAHFSPLTHSKSSTSTSFSNSQGPVKIKRTRQRVDAGEPRNSYASIANFSSTRAAARAQAAAAVAAIHSGREEVKRARVENIVYNMLQVSGPATTTSATATAAAAIAAAANGFTSLADHMLSSSSRDHPFSQLVSPNSKSDSDSIVLAAAAAAAAAATSSNVTSNSSSSQMNGNVVNGSSSSSSSLASFIKGVQAQQQAQQASETSQSSSFNGNFSEASVDSDMSHNNNSNCEVQLSSSSINAAASTNVRKSSSDKINRQSDENDIDDIDDDEQDDDDRDDEQDDETHDGTSPSPLSPSSTSSNSHKKVSDESARRKDSSKKPANDNGVSSLQSPESNEHQQSQREQISQEKQNNCESQQLQSQQQQQQQQQPTNQVNGCKKRKLYQPQQTTKVMSANVADDDEEMLDDDSIAMSPEDKDDIDGDDGELDEELEDEELVSDLSLSKKSASSSAAASPLKSASGQPAATTSQVFSMRKRYVDIAPPDADADMDQRSSPASNAGSEQYFPPGERKGHLSQQTRLSHHQHHHHQSHQQQQQPQQQPSSQQQQNLATFSFAQMEKFKRELLEKIVEDIEKTFADFTRTPFMLNTASKSMTNNQDHESPKELTLLAQMLESKDHHVHQSHNHHHHSRHSDSHQSRRSTGHSTLDSHRIQGGHKLPVLTEPKQSTPHINGASNHRGNQGSPFTLTTESAPVPRSAVTGNGTHHSNSHTAAHALASGFPSGSVSNFKAPFSSLPAIASQGPNNPLMPPSLVQHFTNLADVIARRSSNVNNGGNLSTGNNTSNSGINSNLNSNDLTPVSNARDTVSPCSTSPNGSYTENEALSLVLTPKRKRTKSTPSAPPPLISSLPTSVAIPNPSLHSDFFSSPAFPFADPSSRLAFFGQHHLNLLNQTHSSNGVEGETDRDCDRERIHRSSLSNGNDASGHLASLARESNKSVNSAVMAQAVTNVLAAHHHYSMIGLNRASPESLSGMYSKLGSENGADGSEASINDSSPFDPSIPLTSTLTPMHLRKAKLMFFYVRYPSSSVLKMFFPDIKFNKNNTAQLVKWFSNFREFYYIQMEKYARQSVSEGITRAEDIEVTMDSELLRVLNLHYNRNNHIDVPEHFRFVVEQTLREFFKSIYTGKDTEQSWKKAIYKIIARLDDSVPEYFKSPTFLDQLE